MGEVRKIVVTFKSSLSSLVVVYLFSKLGFKWLQKALGKVQVGDFLHNSVNLTIEKTPLEVHIDELGQPKSSDQQLQLLVGSN